MKKPVIKLPRPEKTTVEMQSVYDRLEYLELQNTMLIRCINEMQKMYKRDKVITPL